MVAMSMGCALDARDGDTAKLSVSFSGVDTVNPPLFSQLIYTPQSISGMDCIAINVTGPGIPPKDGGNHGSGGIVGAHCKYAGELSHTASISGPSTLEVTVPTGPDRMVQVVGLRSTVGCGQDIASQIGQGNGAFDNAYPFAGELGARSVNIFQDMAISVNNTYTPLKSFSNCGGSELPLVAGYKTIGSGQFSTTFTSNAMTSTYLNGATALSPAELEIVSGEQSGTVYHETASASMYPHINFVFDATSFNLSQYSYLQITYTMTSGGNYPSACSGSGVATAGNGFMIKVWDQAAGGWSSAVGSYANFNATSSSFTTTGETTVSFVKANHDTVSGWGLYPGSQYIHVGISTNSPVSSNCAVLSVGQIEVRPVL